MTTNRRTRRLVSLGIADETVHAGDHIAYMYESDVHTGRTMMKAAFEGHPVTLHRNCIRVNPYFVPRSEAEA